MVRRVSQPPFLAQPGGRQQVGIVATVCENAEPRYQNPAHEKELPARNQIGQRNEWGERPKECIPGRLIDTLNNESPGILWDMTTSSVQFDIIIQEDYNQCHTKSSYQTWRSDQRPAPAHLCLLYKCPTQSFETAANPSRFAPFWQGAQSLAPATQNDIWTSKNAPQPFFHFWLRNVLHAISSFKSGLRPSVFYTCSFQIVLRATTACTFSTS